MPSVLLADYSGVVLEPKSDRVQQPNVAGRGIANRRIKQTRIAAQNERLYQRTD